MYRWFTKQEHKQLLSNGKQTQEDGIGDHVPVVKLFTPDAQCTWLLSEIIPGDEVLAFGLCDLGLGTPELGYVSLDELSELRGQLGLPIEKDIGFEGKHPITKYAEKARESACITV